MSEIADATPVPRMGPLPGQVPGTRVSCSSRWMALVATAGVLGQMRMGYFDFEIGLYLRILFGLQLIDYLLFALLVFVVHAVVNQKHARLPRGAHRLRGHRLPLHRSGSNTTCSFMDPVRGGPTRTCAASARPSGRGCGSSCTGRRGHCCWPLRRTLLWARGTERSLWSRLHVARRRFTRPTAGVAATAVALIVTLGGFIFYNTNSLNRYRTASEETERRAEYERRYGKYAGVAQPTAREHQPSRRDLSRSAGGGDPWRLRPREHQFRGDRLHPCDHRPGGRNRSCIHRPARVARARG